MRAPFLYAQRPLKGAWTDAFPVQSLVRIPLAVVKPLERVGLVPEYNRQVREMLRSGVRVQWVLALAYPPLVTLVIVAYKSLYNPSSRAAPRN